MLLIKLSRLLNPAHELLVDIGCAVQWHTVKEKFQAKINIWASSSLQILFIRHVINSV